MQPTRKRFMSSRRRDFFLQGQTESEDAAFARITANIDTAAMRFDNHFNNR